MQNTNMGGHRWPKKTNVNRNVPISGHKTLPKISVSMDLLMEGDTELQNTYVNKLPLISLGPSPDECETCLVRADFFCWLIWIMQP